MKKVVIIAFIFLCCNAYGKKTKFLGRITRRAKNPTFTITQEYIAQDRIHRFNTYLNKFTAIYKPLYGLLENLNKDLISYSNQPQSYQRDYSNLAHFTTLINQIKQKELTIALTKLLQYKTAQHQPNNQPYMMIINLKELITSIESTLMKLERNKDLAIPFTGAAPEKIAELNVADYFKYYVNKQFFFKIKKIKRSLINWDQSHF